jgi:HD-GYP domain-containing protein (c-di-GMP phosphodiesterase class II)
VADLAVQVGKELGLTDGELEDVRAAAELHDVGKIAIPDAILNKPSWLNDEEWEFMRQHTVIGERIVLSAPSLARAAAFIRSSHERMDGTGYPDGLAGAEIPLGARIIAVCDAYDAMTSDRPYSHALTREASLAELRSHAGSQFDAAVVNVFERIVNESSRRDEQFLSAAAPN